MIQVSNAGKKFGNRIALHQVSFAIEEGQIIGLLGTNGAGKSTLLKAMAGLLKLDQGTILFNGTPPSLSTRASTAYLPDVNVWYPWMKLSDAMKYMQDFYWDWDQDKARHLLDFLELTPSSSIQHASKGTQAKMRLLLALSRQARYVLMDEPFSGIDPFARERIAQAIIDDFIDEGQTILLTTQEISEVEHWLDEVLFLHEGQLLLTGQMETFKQDRHQSLFDILKEAYDHARV
ncbi:ABC transporter ATP-binding protein [Paenibacillus guangzhouensis]|uniref:ABC transporter ATP-binding protein n=1 Tax=Paenibacillus guangzhouensis TaxID=1473112 RepID=UPI0012672E3F|nr:ABC transporter ATP-binding protein [Paenibacillus guangzhouensis]